MKLLLLLLLLLLFFHLIFLYYHLLFRENNVTFPLSILVNPLSPNTKMEGNWNLIKISFWWSHRLLLTPDRHLYVFQILPWSSTRYNFWGILRGIIRWWNLLWQSSSKWHCRKLLLSLNISNLSFCDMLANPNHAPCWLRWVITCFVLVESR